jgi:polysaccharide pyruvyl transferase WcaK-like protein
VLDCDDDGRHSRDQINEPTIKIRKDGSMKQCGTTRLRIAFFGHFDSTNFGNESTLQAILYHLRRFRPDVEVTCICTGPEATARTHQIEAIPITERFVKSWVPRNPLTKVVRRVCIYIPGELYQWIMGLVKLRHTDAFIVPGTGLLTDAYGLRRWGPYSLFKWSLIAKVSHCKLFFVSVGAGPIYSVLGRWLVKSALSLADFRSYRDSSTMQYLKDIGFRIDNDRVYPDLVFSLSEPVTPVPAKKSSRTIVGIGLMGYTERYSVPNPSDEIYLRYLENLARFAKWLLAHDYDIRLLIGDVGDTHVTQEFRGLLKERLSACDEGRVLDEPILSVEQLLSQIAATDLVVATRFHNVLLALLCNKPVISISFHPKCESLMSEMGLSAYCLDINTLNADRLIEKLSDLETNAGKLKSRIWEKANEFRNALDEQYNFIFKNM